ncbi:MAG: ferrous iron transport protein B [Actinobacteria bacterium]|nr:ferrous iron transport protein B [Actinomycetota bacterium]
MKKVKLLIIGQPNSGKSSLLNAIIGPKVIISNYPGTTVELTSGKTKINDCEIELIDTPGIYSISDRSEEEKVTENSLFQEKVDGVIALCDATALERSLYMVLQILEAEMPVIIAMNFVEEAKKKGIIIDYKKLEDIFSVPVILINPLTKRGIKTLLEKITTIKDQEKNEFKIEYDDHLEEAIEKVSKNVSGKFPKRFVALRVLEEDKDFNRYLSDEKLLEKINSEMEKHQDISKDVAVTRFGTATYIANNVTNIISLKRENRFEDKIDSIVVNKVWGPVTTVLFFIILFGIILLLGNLLQGFLMDATEKLIKFLSGVSSSAAFNIFGQGLTGLAIGVSIALPYVFLFYLLIGFIEDTGLLSRFIINMERFTARLGLPGKSFIPLALGIGCSVPAIRATRVLDSKKEQFHSASFLAFIPCSSRIAVIMGIAGFYGGIKLAIYVYATMAVFALIFAFIIKKIIRAKPEPLILELPPYRKPIIGNIFAKSWIRMKDFVYIVIPLLVFFGMIYGILDTYGLTGYIVKPFSFITAWLGLPENTIIPLFFGFFQKDLTGAMLLSVLGSDVSAALTPLQIYTFSVASTIGIPCIIAFGMLIKEFGFKKAALLTLSLNIYGILIAGAMWRLFVFIRNIVTG